MEGKGISSEKRRHLRFDYSRLISFTHYDPANDVEIPGRMAAVHDLSESGILIQTAEQLEPGNILDLDIAFEQEKIIRAQGEVVHQRKGGKGLSYTGIKFTKIDAADLEYLKAFVDSQTDYRT